MSMNDKVWGSATDIGCSWQWEGWEIFRRHLCSPQCSGLLSQCLLFASLANVFVSIKRQCCSAPMSLQSWYLRRPKPRLFSSGETVLHKAEYITSLNYALLVKKKKEGKKKLCNISKIPDCNVAHLKCRKELWVVDLSEWGGSWSLLESHWLLPFYGLRVLSLLFFIKCMLNLFWSLRWGGGGCIKTAVTQEFLSSADFHVELIFKNIMQF